MYVAEEEPEDWFIAALERYRAAQQREEEAHRQAGNGPGNNSLTQVAADIVWREKEEPELRRALTEDLLSGYTKVSLFRINRQIVLRSSCNEHYSSQNDLG